MPERRFYWAELKSKDFRSLDPEKTVAVLPVAAIEQHGPHLPVMTDTAIAAGMLDLLKARLPADLDILVLPIQAFGKSNEHILSPGTVTLSAETLTRMLVEIGESVHRAGLRKLVLINSHGGNVPVLGIVTRELRVRLGMLAVATQWGRFGHPDGLYEPVELRHGIHAGDIETSLMLQFRPDLVDTASVKNFVSSALAMEQQFSQLSATGAHGFGWIAQDLNVDGAVGDASKGTADKGQKSAMHQVDGFVALLRDMTAFRLDRLFAAPAD